MKEKVVYTKEAIYTDSMAISRLIYSCISVFIEIKTASFLSPYKWACYSPYRYTRIHIRTIKYMDSKWTYLCIIGPQNILVKPIRHVEGNSPLMYAIFTVYDY